MNIFRTPLFAIALALFSVGQSTAQVLVTQKRFLPTGAGNAERILQISTNKFLVVGKGNSRAYVAHVDRFGQQNFFRQYPSEIGGIRSEFTDAVRTVDGWILLGDCDACNPDSAADQSRKMILMRVDTNFNLIKIVRLSTPTNLSKPYTWYGWQKIRQEDEDKFVIAGQLLYSTTGSGRLTDFALVKIDNTLNVQSSKALDINPMDNIGDLEVINDKTYLLTFGVPAENAIAIGKDTTSFLRFSTNGDLEQQYKYPGAGLCMTPLVGGDWAIGGAMTPDLIKGPQAMIMRINGVTGEVMKTKIFGTDNKIDAVTDIVQVPSGYLLTTSALNATYPNLVTLLQNYDLLFLDPTIYPFPKTTQVNRFNSTTLANLGGPIVMPNTENNGVILRSIRPINSPGNQFVAVGYSQNRSTFFSSAGISFGNNPIGPTNTNPNDPDGGLTPLIANVFPNPVSNGSFTLEVAREFLPSEYDGSQLVGQIYDLSGRLVQRFEFDGYTVPTIAAPKQNGVYFLQVLSNENLLGTTKFVVEEN